MAQTNADGSIILSTTIDTSGIKKGLDQVKQKTKETTKTQQDQEKTTQKQTNAYEQLKKRVQEQTAALQKMKAEYSSIILTEGKTSEAAQALSSKMATLSGILEENKAKLAGVEQEANDLVSSFSKVGNEAQESAEKPKNAYQQLEETIAEQKTRLEEIRQEYASLKLTNQGNTTQAKKLKAEINNLSAEVAENEARIKSLGLTSSSAFAQMKSGLMALASYFIGIQTIFAAFRFSGEAGEFATQTEASVQRLVDIYGEASGAVGDFIDQNARALGMSKSAAASFSSVYGNLFSAFADQETNAALTNEYLQMTAVVASKTGRTVEDVQERIRSGLLGNTEAIEDLGIFVNVKTIEMTDAFQRMADGKSWEQLDAYTQQQIRSMAILEQATAKYGDEVADTSATIRNEFKAAYEDFQNSWGTVVNQVLIPTLQILTEVFNIATAGLNAISGRSGKILEDVEVITDNSEETAENIEQQTKNQKELNKELKKSLAGFDDIQILSAQTAENTSGGLDGGLQGLGGEIGGTLDGSAYVNEVDTTLTAIMGVVSVALMALGCILLFTGNIAWGLGFIIAGAGAFSVVAATLKNDEISQKTKDALSAALIITGAVAILIGIILCMAGQWGIGVSLMVIGAASIVTPIALNWNGIKEQLQTSLGGWLALGGIVAIVLGILLCFTPALPLGIGLIVLGAGAVVAPIVANWDAIMEWVTGAFNTVKEWIATYGGLVLGIILVLSGVAAPFGWALIMDSVNSLGKGQKPALWSNILDSIKKTWNDIKSYWNANIANIWTLEFWLGLAKTAGNGLISGFELAINGIIGMFENMINLISRGLNKISFNIPDWVPGIGGKTFGLNIPEATLKRISIPRLAQGAVIPPNREFLAVLGDQKQGTNIETPLATMVEAFNMALNSRGNDTVKEEHYYLDESEIMRIIYRLAKKGEQAQGDDLLESW